MQKTEGYSWKVRTSSKTCSPWDSSRSETNRRQLLALSFLPFVMFQTFTGTYEEKGVLTQGRSSDMKSKVLLEEKHLQLKNELDEKLHMKHNLEMEITRRFKELKRLETSLEKRSCLTEKRARSQKQKAETM